MTDLAETLTAELKSIARGTERVLGELLPDHDASSRRLSDAMRYSIFSGGKRLRPILLVKTARLFGVKDEPAFRTAAAVEAIHCSSLVFDDLPGMDDDAVRHNKPTAHVAFDEATAILAGNGLISFAFETLADPRTHADAGVRLELTRLLAESLTRLQCGQQMDLSPARDKFGIDEIAELQRLKTGALLACAVESGAVLDGATKDERRALNAFAYRFGEAFQIANDFQDKSGDAATVGKAVGRDEAEGKATYIRLLGAHGAQSRMQAVLDDAASALSVFGDRASDLKDIASFMTLHSLRAIALFDSQTVNAHRPGLNGKAARPDGCAV